MRPVQTFITGARSAGSSGAGSVGEVHDGLHAPDTLPTHLPTVAYFSPEFGVSADLPLYAGGLGVLAGDHLKAADALGVPLVGVGLFYDEGYFSQRVDDTGTQHAHYERLDAVALGLTALDDVRVHLEVAGAPVVARVWVAHVGTVPLYLLDTDVEGNDPAHRRITNRLYGGGPTERMRQELVLGVGGMRLLDALGHTPEVIHLNEGHAGFSLLERLRSAMLDDGLGWDEAIEWVRATAVFTTHTPVPAGIDRFDAALVREHFGDWCDELGVPLTRLLELGHEPGTPPGSAFNMAVLCLRLCGSANGVSRLHGGVSRAMFSALWPQLPAADAPIGSITNGVDAATWVARPMAALLASHLGPRWSTAAQRTWEAVDAIDDAELWEVRRRQRTQMVDEVRRRLAASGGSRGGGDVLDPDALSIGFARRFATYKRAGLLTGDPDALAALVTDDDRPVQFIFAGKAHPNDAAGQALIAQVTGCARELGIDHRLVFVEDYDMALAAALVSGCDVWLNTPVRPMEACGTSGMKAALNGGLNCSIPDGWWDEWGGDELGWVVPSDDDEADPRRRDTLERASVLDVLGGSVAPMFWDRDAAGRPAGWLALVRHSLRYLGPRVVATRMVSDYVARAYVPAARRGAALTTDAVTSRLERRHRLSAAWPTLSITEVSVVPGDGADDARVQATVDVGALNADDVVVEAVWGPLDPDGNFARLNAQPLAPLGAAGGSPHAAGTRYAGDVPLGGPGEVGVTVRVVPTTPPEEHHATWGLAHWAQATSGSPSSTA